MTVFKKPVYKGLRKKAEELTSGVWKTTDRTMTSNVYSESGTGGIEMSSARKKATELTSGVWKTTDRTVTSNVYSESGTGGIEMSSSEIIPN